MKMLISFQNAGLGILESNLAPDITCHNCNTVLYLACIYVNTDLIATE